MEPLSRNAGTMATTVPLARRSPQRITITLNWATHQRLLDRSDNEGRSMSNLAAHLIETSIAGKSAS
jgi:hypothetical protein